MGEGGGGDNVTSMGVVIKGGRIVVGHVKIFELSIWWPDVYNPLVTVNFSVDF